MSSYVQRTLDTEMDLPGLCSASLSTVSELDAMTRAICSKLDCAIKKRLKYGPNDKLDENIMVIRELVDGLTDSKAGITMKAYDLIDQCTRVVDEDIKTVETAIRLNRIDTTGIAPIDVPLLPSANNNTQEKIEENEPIYCLCQQVAFGEMVSCDNDDCEIEWFHYACVGLTKEPRSHWFCQFCTGGRRRGG
jgi:hypothetical protein